MEEAERRVPPQRKADPDHFLERPYLDVCLSDEDELSDWSEEDLSLHFSASVLKSSESESEPEPGLGPGTRPEPGLELGLESGLVLDQAEPDQTGPQSQVQSPDWMDFPEHKLRPQQEQQRPHQFLRQHSLPEAGGGAYKGLIAGLQTHSGEVQVQRKLQKSFSLDESRTKMASCLIKNVLSKRMQDEDQQGAPRPTQSKDQQGAPRPTQSKDQQGAPRPTQSKPRPRPALHGSGLQSKPPSRGHMIKLAASLSQSQRRAETSQPITGQRCSSQPITARIQLDHSNVHQSEQTSRELQAPHPSPSAQDQSSSLGRSLPSEEPPCFSSREHQIHSSHSAQEPASSVGRRQSAVDPSRELQRKASHAPTPPQRKVSSVGSTQPVVDPLRFSSRELHDPVPTAQEKTSSVGHTWPLPHRFSSSRRLQTRSSRSSPSAEEQASALGQSQADLDPSRFSPRELHSEARHTFSSAQEQALSLGHHMKAVPPPWASSKDPPPLSGSSQEQRLLLGQRKLAVAPPWFSSRDAPRSSAQDQASSVGRVRPVAPWSSSSGEIQAPLPPRSAQDEAPSVGRVRPALPWLSSGPGGKAVQSKTLLDPETGQFVQVFVPMPSPAPLLHSSAPVFAGPAPSVLGYAPLLPVTPNPTLLVQVQPTVFSQTCFMFPSIQPWVYYRPT